MAAPIRKPTVAMPISAANDTHAIAPKHVNVAMHTVAPIDSATRPLANPFPTSLFQNRGHATLQNHVQPDIFSGLYASSTLGWIVYPLYTLFTQLSSVTENLVKVGAVIYQAFRNIFRQTLTNRELKASIKRYMTRLSRVIYLLVREYEKSFSYSLFKPFLLVTEQSTDLFRPTSFKRASPPFHLKF